MFRVAVFIACVTPVAASEASELVATMRGHRDDVCAVAFASDGMTIASGSSDKSVRIWNVDRAALVCELAQGNEVRALCFSLDDKSVAVGGTATTPTRIWSINESRVLQSFRERAAVLALHLSREGTLRTIDMKDQLNIRDTTNRTVRTVTLGGIFAYQISGDGEILSAGHWITSVGELAPVTLWTKDGTKIKTIDEIGRPIALSRDGKLLAAEQLVPRLQISNTSTIAVYDTSTKSIAARLRSKGTAIGSFSNSGRHLAVSNGSNIELWDVTTGRHVTTLATGYAVTCMAFAPHDRLLVSGSGDHGVRIWNLDLSKSK